MAIFARDERTATGWSYGMVEDLDICSLDGMTEVCRKFNEMGGEVYDEIIRGSLLCGVTICTGVAGYWNFVFCEVPTSDWNSVIAYKRYRHLPKKYQRLINAYEDDVPLEMEDEARREWEECQIKLLNR